MNTTSTRLYKLIRLVYPDLRISVAQDIARYYANRVFDVLNCHHARCMVAAYVRHHHTDYHRELAKTTNHGEYRAVKHTYTQLAERKIYQELCNHPMPVPINHMKMRHKPWTMQPILGPASDLSAAMDAA